MSRLSGTVRVWILAMVLTSMAATLGIATTADHAARPSPLPMPLMALVVALTFSVAETKVVHLHIGSSAHSFSMAEIPLVVGVFFLDPLSFVLARVIGGGLALAIARRQRSVKLAFNVAQFALGAVVAATVVHVLAGEGTGFGPLEWLVGYAATIGENLIAVAAIATAISLTEGHAQFDRIPEMLQTGLLVSLTNTSIAMLAIVVIGTTPVAMALFAVPIAVVFLAYRAYVEQTQQKRGLQMLYETTKILHQTPEAERVVAELLAHMRVMFRGEVAEMTLLASTQGEAHLRATSRDDGTVPTLVEIDPQIDDPLLRRAIDGGRPQLVTVADPALAPRFRNAMVVPLQGEHRIIGTLVVANRMSDISTFDQTDMAMFETLASHIAVSLENDQLEASLKRLAELKEELHHQANHDALTGLANRALFVDAVDARLEAAQRGGRVLVVLFLDLDDFKVVNDTMGHPTGDELLRAAGQRISETVRGEDVAARLGGDEFAILLWDREDLTGSRRLADRLLAILAEPYRIDSSIVSIRASIGVAADLDGSIPARDLMKQADVAMYVAKASGKGRVVFFEQTMSSSLERRTSTVAALRHAIEADQLVLHYQPVVDLGTGQVVGTEALVRWEDPGRGLIPPLEFIPLAEQSDLILDLGDWVLRRALGQMRAWQALGEPFSSWWMSVNISSRQLAQDDFVVGMARTVRRSGIAPGSLALELTESGLIADAAGASQKLNALRAIGVRVLLDDFGTGYSSLAYLQRFPVNALKIAREFVDVDPDDDSAWGLAAAIVAMARTLALDVIAEGVEQPGQLKRLTDLGCTQAQGFLLARPVPAREIEAHYGRPMAERAVRTDAPRAHAVVALH